MNTKNKFTLYLDYWEWLKLLTDEELGRLLRSVFIYEREGVVPRDNDDKITIFFYMIKETLDRDRKHYETVCNRNRLNAKSRWQKTKEQ